MRLIFLATHYSLIHYTKIKQTHILIHLTLLKDTYHQGPDFDDMSSFCPCEIDDAIKYNNPTYGAQAPKIVIL